MLDGLDPAGEDGVGVFGLYDNFHKQGFRLRLKDTAELDRRLEGKPEAYRRLDSAILETLVLKGLAGMSDEDITRAARARVRQEHPRRPRPARGRRLRRRLHPAPGPDRAGEGRAETDENMPPKSTYFFPKVMTGIAFNPVG